MPENKELIEYVDANSISRGIVGMHFFPDMECLLPKNYLQHQQRIKDLEVFEDDIWILSYPKCGTTWCQEMVWLVANNLDYNGADVFIDTRYSFMEFGTFVDHDKINTSKNIIGAPIVPDTLKQAEHMPRPRFIKSHLPLALLPTQLFKTKPKDDNEFYERGTKMKIIYYGNNLRTMFLDTNVENEWVFFVLRDPRDTAVSYLHHYRLLQGYSGTEEKFYEAFLQGCLNYGCYWHYLAKLWELRQESNMMTFTYEDMKKDLSDVIRRTASFLGKTVKEEDMAGLLDHLSFTKMKANDATNYITLVKGLKSATINTAAPDGQFMRKGEVGDYKNAMSHEMVEKFQQHHIDMKKKLGLADDKDFPY